MVYFVTHPNLDVTALVHAPSTEKARTTFLDYLERTGRISRAGRQYWRRNMVAEKMEDPYDVTADVELYYGYESPGVPEVPYEEFRPRREVWESFPDAEIPEEPLDLSYVPEVEQHELVRRSIGEVAKETPRRLSPIQKLALRGYVE